MNGCAKMIKVKNVHKRFDVNSVLCGVNFYVGDGETLIIIGSSGAGKSVLLKTVTGLIKPDIGSVIIDSIDITKCSLLSLREVQKKVGYVFQEAALFDSFDVFENVAFGLRNLTQLSEIEIKKRVIECLEMFNLGRVGHLRPFELSGGMKKRVGLARAIAYYPRYILYDEPTAGLDPVLSDTVTSLVVNLKKQFGITSIIVTHDIKLAYKVADRMVMLYKGIVVFDGTPEEIKCVRNKYIREFIGSGIKSKF
jgi:phospholipid/cholesterol/gamma-HCH transport system ATP-binding protein